MTDKRDCVVNEREIGECSAAHPSSVLINTDDQAPEDSRSADPILPIQSQSNTPIFPGNSRSDSNRSLEQTQNLSKVNGSDCSICRICQLGSEESAEPLRDTTCDCKGSVKRVHASCLVLWVRQKGSNSCEICGGTFFVSPPTSQPDLVPILSVHEWPSNASTDSSRIEMCLANRCVFVVLIFLLIIVTGSAAAFTVKSFKVLQTAHDSVSGDPHLQFLLCLCFLLLSGTATLMFLSSWIYLETATHCRMMRRRRILQSLGITI